MVVELITILKAAPRMLCRYLISSLHRRTQTWDLRNNITYDVTICTPGQTNFTGVGIDATQLISVSCPG